MLSLNRAYTWFNGTTLTRIDYIWISSSWLQTILDVTIIDLQLITDSNHKIIRSMLDITDVISRINKQQEGKNIQKIGVWIW